jgi:hypothetical protein
MVFRVISSLPFHPQRLAIALTLLTLLWPPGSLGTP